MSRKKRKWRFFWKNFNGLGRINRVIAGIALFAVANMMKDDKLMSGLLASWGCVFIFDALLRWSPYRAILKWPSKRAYLRHYPEGG